MTLDQVFWASLAAVNAGCAFRLAAYAVEFGWTDDAFSRSPLGRIAVTACAIGAGFLGGLAAMCVWRAFQ